MPTRATTTWVFQAYTRATRATGRCPVCSKRVVRSRTFEETESPFNKNENGTVKSPGEIMASLKAKADAWVPDFTHERCRA